VIASRVEHGAIARTRPLCPYPQSAAYTAVGSTNDSKNFVSRQAFTFEALERSPAGLQFPAFDFWASKHFKYSEGSAGEDSDSVFG
jgi:hypothetical protein